MSTAIATPVLRDLTRDRLRTEHRVRLLNSEEEGTAFDKLPTGVYGFSYAPATETPLFSQQSYHSFEIHKLPDGSGRLLVFCTEQDAEQIARSQGDIEITAYPDTWQNAGVLVPIQMRCIATSLYKPVRRDGNAIPLRLVW